MKKHVLVTIFTFMLVAGLALNADAKDCENCLKKAGKRLCEGTRELLSAPMELGDKTAYYSEEIQPKTFGIFAGLLEGAGAVTVKVLSGTIKILTFPFNTDTVDYDYN